MPTILLDSQPVPIATVPSTWGALLEWVDGWLADRQLIVTDVRFDGLDEPAFRDPAVLERTLADLAVLEIVSGTPAALMSRCLSDAASAIEPLCQACLAVADEFRLGRSERASEGLVEVAEGLTTLTSIVGAAGLALRVDLADVAYSEGTALSAVNELSGFVEAIIDAQQRADWIALADVLQYDIEPALRRWQPLLDALATPGVETV